MEVWREKERWSLVAAIYKKKAVKVRPVDPDYRNGVVPGGKKD